MMGCGCTRPGGCLGPELILDQEENGGTKSLQAFQGLKQRLWACICPRTAGSSDREESVKVEARETRWLHVLVPDELDLDDDKRH